MHSIEDMGPFIIILLQQMMSTSSVSNSSSDTNTFNIDRVLRRACVEDIPSWYLQLLGSVRVLSINDTEHRAVIHPCISKRYMTLHNTPCRNIHLVSRKQMIMEY